MSTIQLNKLRAIYATLKSQNVSYKMGAKANPLTLKPNQIQKLDCSGFSRYAVFNATAPAITIPEGTWAQDDYCKNTGWKAVNYVDVGQGKPDELFIAFESDAPGHVWFINKGMTMECHGGVGVNSRNWNNKVLLKIVTRCYLVPTA